MSLFAVKIEDSALQDIQAAIDYYEEQQVGLGKKFESAVHRSMIKLSKHPFYQIRYDNIRCYPLKKYPFMIHFQIQEAKKIVQIIAIFHTSQNPVKWTKSQFLE